VHRLALGIWERTSTGTLFGKGFKLVLLTSWISLLNKLTLSVFGVHFVLNGHSAVLGIEVGYS
jgi:hypothetical protein